MPTLRIAGNGVQTTWNLPVHDGAATAVGATIASQDFQSITFTTPPALGSFVTINYEQPSSLASAGQQSVDVLSGIGVARQVPAGAASASVPLSPQCRRVSLLATEGAVFFTFGVGPQTATADSHYIAVNERLDFRVPAGATIAARRGGSGDATLQVTELN